MIELLKQLFYHSGEESSQPVRTAGIGDTTLHSLALTTYPDRRIDYLVALLVSALVLMLRAAVEPLVENDYLFVLALFGVVLVSWRSGMGPGIVTLLVSMFGMVYFFVPPKFSLVISGLGNQLAAGMFLFCGVCCAGLGEAQWVARRRAKTALSVALEKKAELEVEVARRREVENTILQREIELTELNRKLTVAQEQTAAALAQARESEERFRSIANSVPVLIWVSEQTPQRSFFNKTWLEFTGRNLQQELSDGWAENIYPDDRERYFKVYNESFNARKPFELEYRLRRHDGEFRWVLARGVPRFTSAGSFAGFSGLCLDVTDHKRAEEHVRASEARYRTLTEAIPQLVWNAASDGRAVYFNKKWFDYTGQSPSQSQGDGWIEAFHPDDVEQFRHKWQMAIAREVPDFSAEFRLRRAEDNAYRWMLSNAISQRDPSGSIVEWVGSIADIDDQKRQAVTLEKTVQERTTALLDEVEERKRIEHQLRDIAAELSRSNKELEQFAYVASHDLQEPLRKIQAFGDRLLTKFSENLPEPGKECVDRMNISASRMRRLIDDLLSFSRVTTQARPFALVDLEKLIQEVVSDLDVYINQYDGVVEIDKLPQIHADATQMRQLFQNLIANAIKFHRANVPPVVAIRGEWLQAHLPNSDGELVAAYRIVVQDNGIGFDEKYRERIFQVFQRLHGRHEYEGTGVGLAICRKIAERHGGTIEAKSLVGEGSTFIVTLPVRQITKKAESDVRSDQEISHDPDSRR
ncbi:MAG TPA: PAS domain S-box protein [Gemmata sp.]|nr:PAS domain S-box protein [Gemmata sp.]